MNIEILLKYWNGISSLFLEMSPFLMLGFLISGLLYIIISKEFISNNLGKPGLLSIIKAAIFGVPMPLCSCGVIPVATSLYKRGASRGATISFLISTPQTGVDSIFITYSLLGLPFAIIRPLIALITGVIGGFLSEFFITKDDHSTYITNHTHPSKTLQDGLKYGFITLPKDISSALIIGILISGLISILVPQNFFLDYNLTGVLGMALIGIASIPIYVCATASVPIAITLISKGLDPGSALVFLMAGPATNVATISVIMKSLGRKTIFLYIATIFSSSIFFGTLINLFLDKNTIPIMNQSHHMHFDLISIVSAIALILICAYAIINNSFNKTTSENAEASNSADLSFIVKGMTCNHCKETVTEAINTCDGIQDFTINLESGQTFIYGNNLNKQQIITSINNVGFSIGEIT